MNLTKRIDELTPENILKHVSPYDIVRAFWPPHKELVLDKGSISSPFRKDENGSLLIGERDGVIVYKDMGDLTYRGDHWNFVKQIENLKTFRDVLKIVDKRFNLGYSDGNAIKGKSEIITWEQPIHVPRKPTLIQVTARAWQKSELMWWNQYHLDISDLKANEIYVPSAIYRNRKKIQLEEHTYCYYFPETGKWKIYRPLGESGKKVPVSKRKWDNSMDDLQYVEDIQNLKGATVGILGKARKDKMVLEKATGLPVCSMQAEDPSAINDEQLKFIDRECKIKISTMDKDKKGAQVTEWLVGQGYMDMTVPIEHENVTDYADWGREAKTLDVITEHFRSKKLIV